MSHNAQRDPWRIESDGEDEKDGRLHSLTAIKTQSTIPKVKKLAAPRLLDWDTPIDEPSVDPRSSERISSSSSSSSSAGPQRQNDSLLPTSIPESPPASPAIANTSNFDPIALIQEDLNKFVNTPIAKDYPVFVQCRLKRDKDGVQGSFTPTFYLHAERFTDRKKFFLLAARKLAKVNRHAEYIITTNVETLSEKTGGDGYIGKLRGTNLSGTEYVLYDNGLSPNKSSHYKHATDGNNFRRELGAVVYNTNILGFKGPRQMSAMVPEIGRDIRPMKGDDGIIDQWKDGYLTNLIQLKNKSPKYNEETKNYVLQFTGNRVAQPSVKNFQMVIENENHEEEVVMQFGRVDDDTFTCDYRYPLTAYQAFGIALSSFDSRLTRE